MMEDIGNELIEDKIYVLQREYRRSSFVAVVRDISNVKGCIFLLFLLI
jgi:hypothetical protein